MGKRTISFEDSQTTYGSFGDGYGNGDGYGDGSGCGNGTEGGDGYSEGECYYYDKCGNGGDDDN